MTSPSSPSLLEVCHLSKSYGIVPVLHDISFCIQPGQIIGLIGENGAGKSTLAKCLNGLEKVTDGTIAIEGKPILHNNVHLARRLGIITIPQEFDLENDLSVAANIFLGRERVNALGFLKTREMNHLAESYLNQLDCHLNPATPVRELGVAEKQFVEIAKALSQQCRILILDEPTTVLNREEVERLFRVMRQLRAQGATLLFVSHKLHEVREICDRIIILRDGHLVGDTPIAEVDEAEMARRMVGRELRELYPPKSSPPLDAPVLLQVDGLSSQPILHEVSFSLRRGEILGFAGLLGAGRTELAECLYGLRPTTSGQILLDGKVRHFPSPASAVAAGISYLSEDRQGSGILPTFSIAANTTLASLKKYCHPFLSRRQENLQASHYIRTFSIKADGPSQPLSELSGGNQQKVAIAKGLDTEPRLFIFDEPTRGIDISAKSEIYRFIHQLLERGIACIFISSDIEELLGMCPRIAVMHEGHLAGILEGDALTEENIMLLATGQPLMTSPL
ncbi:MAG: sugar ABC transporter ATP-binding protein [Victivallales bacterium]|nr:sugar ABC transporter ATP-binding protein [Victivallales bacterium]